MKYTPPPVHAALHEDINSGPKSREEHETIVVCAKHLMYVLQEIVKNKKWRQKYFATKM
jgi:hypothetical protein